jgi:N-acyl-D-aspartate/D-glutamate deacylase
LLEKQGVRWRTFADFLEQVDRRGVSANVAPLIGHGNLRTIAMGWASRPPTEPELDVMRAEAARAMEEGAFGMSTGLIYAPGFFSDTHELVEIMKVVARYGGFYATHMRNETSRELYRASVSEAINIGRLSGSAVQISHLETHYPNWGMQSEVLALLESARAQGVDVTCDVPPYLSGDTSVSAALPDWVQEGGYDKALARLCDPETRRKLREDRTSKRGIPGALLLGGHWDKMWLRRSLRHPEYSGKSLAEVAEMRGDKPDWDVLFDILVEEGGDLQVNGQWHDEDDIRTLVSHPLCMIETDASVVLSRDISANPRAYGAFPLVLRKYVRGESREEIPGDTGARVLTLQEAVRKMTSAAAQRLGLRDRGLVREGMWADLVVLDADAVADRTTYVRPHQFPAGIDYVLVNGQVTVDHGRHLGTLAGKALRRGR